MGSTCVMAGGDQDSQSGNGGGGAGGRIGGTGEECASYQVNTALE